MTCSWCPRCCRPQGCRAGPKERKSSPEKRWYIYTHSLRVKGAAFRLRQVLSYAAVGFGFRLKP